MLDRSGIGLQAFTHRLDLVHLFALSRKDLGIIVITEVSVQLGGHPPIDTALDMDDVIYGKSLVIKICDVPKTRISIDVHAVFNPLEHGYFELIGDFGFHSVM